MEMAVQSGKSMLKNKKGLTLFELLAILVIIGIVAAIAIPAVNKTIDNSKVKADAANVKLFEDAAIRYAMETPTVKTGDTVTDTQLVAAGYLNAEISWAKTSNDKSTATFTVSATGVITVVLS